MISYSRFVFFVRQCPMWDGAQLGGVPRPLDGTARSNKKRREREYTKAHWTKPIKKGIGLGMMQKQKKKQFFYHILCIRWTSFSFNPWPYSYLKISPSSKMFIFLLQIFSSFSFFVNPLLWQTKLFTSSKIQNIKFKEDNAESVKFRQRQTKSAHGQFWACLVQSCDCLTDNACLGLRSLLRPEGSAWTILNQNWNPSRTVWCTRREDNVNVLTTSMSYKGLSAFRSQFLWQFDKMKLPPFSCQEKTQDTLLELALTFCLCTHLLSHLLSLSLG